uniref:Uncharacterized protein n=1 Tax=Arundo donax TaxID=35708 RepID=A0A0A8ZSU5_ARUDO
MVVDCGLFLARHGCIPKLALILKPIQRLSGLPYAFLREIIIKLRFRLLTSY